MNNVTLIFFTCSHNKHKLDILFFILVLVLYCVTACGNFLIVILVSISKALHTPMYFFLSQLSIADIILTTNISPSILNIVLCERPSISFPGCMLQFFFFGMTEAAECYLLTVMSYDRYLAICSPLHYASIMNQMFCIKSVLASWLLSCLFASLLALGISQLDFCGPNTINHFFCDFSPLLELSCSDASFIQICANLVGIPVIILPFLLIIISYTHIVITILKISSFAGRLKTFSTCSSHLTVVFLFYGTLFSMYGLPSEGKSELMNKILSIFYTVVTPFCNPFIYSLRNNDIKEALKKVIFNKKFDSKNI